MSKCRGCGVLLQDSSPLELGYTMDIQSYLCERCFRLKYYGEYRNVSLTNDDYKKIIASIPKDGLVLYVTDILSLDLDFLSFFENVLLVVTKRDIMPKSLNEEKTRNYFLKRYSNILDVVVVSSIKNYHLDLLYKQILTYVKDRVYLVGNTNSGKSTLLNQFIHDYGEGEGMITTSMYPSTTLNEVRIDFSDFTLIDTPGLLGKGNLVHLLDKKELKMVTPRKEIRPKSCQVEGKGSLLVGNFVRIDYEAMKRSSFVIYVSNDVPIRFANYEKNTYRDRRCVQYFVDKGKDIVIPGLGFIKFMGNFTITLYLPYEVDAKVRDSFIA